MTRDTDPASDPQPPRYKEHPLPLPRRLGGLGGEPNLIPREEPGREGTELRRQPRGQIRLHEVRGRIPLPQPTVRHQEIATTTLREVSGGVFHTYSRRNEAAKGTEEGARESVTDLGQPERMVPYRQRTMQHGRKD